VVFTACVSSFVPLTLSEITHQHGKGALLCSSPQSNLSGIWHANCEALGCQITVFSAVGDLLRQQLLGFTS
jgi:hypothetical protein